MQLLIQEWLSSNPVQIVKGFEKSLHHDVVTYMVLKESYIQMQSLHHIQGTTYTLEQFF